MKTRRLRERLSGWPLAIALFAGLLPALLATSNRVRVVIMHTNDIHGHLLPSSGIGGMAEIATIIRKHSPHLLFDGGDMYSGSMISDNFQGEPMIEIMNALGYSAAALGNHEFDFGQDALRNRIRQAHFPILSVNVQSPLQEIEETAIVEARGIQFGIIGLTTEELMTATHSKNLEGVSVLGKADAIARVLPRLRDRVDMIMAIAHLREDEELAVARAYPELRLILGGHTDKPTPKPVMHGQTMVVRAGKYGNYVGRVELEFVDDKLFDLQGEAIPVNDGEPDPAISRLIEPWKERIGSFLRTAVGEAEEDLLKSTTEESALPNLIADVIRRKTGTQLALTNLGGIRTSIPRGPITEAQLYELLPFPNTLVTLDISGQNLKAALGVQLAAVSGLRVVVDNSKPKGQRLVSVTLADGSPVVDHEVYTITTNDFTYAGGDGYTQFKNGSNFNDTGITIRNAFREFLAGGQPVRAVLDGRVTVRN